MLWHLLYLLRTSRGDRRRKKEWLKLQDWIAYHSQWEDFYD